MRLLSVATVSFLIEDTPHTVAMNLERAIGYIAAAAKSGAHIVLLPETVTTFNVPREAPIAEDYPGEWTSAFSEAAKRNRIAVIAPYYVREGGAIHNQATLFNINGEIVGYYRKAQPTGYEAPFVKPGEAFPILTLSIPGIGETKIAIMICMDIYFAEIARIYAMKGSEILFWPTITHGPTQSGLEAQIRTRAMDNSLWVVESNLAGHPPYAPYYGRFYPGTARIVNPDGEIVANTGRRHGIAMHTIDLDERRVTDDIILIQSPDDTRADLESLARLDLYAREYAMLAATQHRFYDTLNKSNEE